MSKKNFKQDIGKLIEASSVKQVLKDAANEANNSSVDYLNFKINQLLCELKLWRTGELTVQKFHSSLAKANLKYNEQNNDFEIISE
jgi:hypothetical protein